MSRASQFQEMWIITAEDECGVWWDDPGIFGSKDEAKEFIAYAPKLPKEWSYVLWECRQVKARGK